MLVFNFTTPHTDFDIKHDLKWMERKKERKGNEKYEYLPFNSTIAFYFMT
jgi:hypothetical protein